LSEIFFILRRIQRDIIKNVYRSSHKVPFSVSDVNEPGTGFRKILHHENPSTLWPWVRLSLKQKFLGEEGGKGGRYTGLTLPPSCADCHEIWQVQLHRTLRACPVLYRDYFPFFFFFFLIKGGGFFLIRVLFKIFYLFLFNF